MMNINFQYLDINSMDDTIIVTVENVDYIPRIGESIYYEIQGNRILTGIVNRVAFDYTNNNAEISFSEFSVKEKRE